jgi:hypothetical protein
MHDAVIVPVCACGAFGAGADVVVFESDAPVAHLTRALFELDRTGFKLEALNVSAAPGLARVRLAFAVRGTISADNYAARLARMPGITAVVLNPAAR